MTRAELVTISRVTCTSTMCCGTTTLPSCHSSHDAHFHNDGQHGQRGFRVTQDMRPLNHAPIPNVRVLGIWYTPSACRKGGLAGWGAFDLQKETRNIACHYRDLTRVRDRERAEGRVTVLRAGRTPRTANIQNGVAENDRRANQPAARTGKAA